LTQQPQQQRPIEDYEAAGARRSVGFLFWYAPGLFVLATLASVVAAILYGGAAIILFVAFTALTAFILPTRIRTHRGLSCDLQNGMVHICQGLLYRVQLDRTSGFCFVKFADQTVRVPNEYFRELQESKQALIEFLP
jgi:hypothetical protein